MCRWDVVDFMLICGVFWARFWWGWVSKDGSFLNAVLGWNFTNLVRLKWMYVIAMALDEDNTCAWHSIIQNGCNPMSTSLLLCFFLVHIYVKLCDSSCWSQGLLILFFFPLFAAESAQLADFMADTFHSIPLSVSGIPLAFPIDSRFCQVCTAQDCPNRLTKGVLTWQNPRSTTHSLPTF